MTGQSTPYRPQRHAIAVEESNSKLDMVLQSLATLRGQIAHLSIALQPSAGLDLALDALIGAAFDAMGDAVWLVGELLHRSTVADPYGLALATAIAGTGCKPSAKGLGKYLSNRIKTGTYSTEDGLQIALAGNESVGLIWMVKRL